MQGTALQAGHRERQAGPQSDAGLALPAEVRRFEASDGYPIHYRWWAAAGPPRGYVVGLHGIQSHSGWYAYTSSRLAEAGWDVSFLDRRGSGLNRAGRRGHAPHCDRLVNDVAQFLGEVRFRRQQEAPRSPVVLMGVSWGGKLAAVTCARRPELADALALLYPGIFTRVSARPHQRFIVRLVKWLGGGHHTAALPLEDVELFTDQPRWQEWIRTDPLSLRRVTVSFLAASQRLDELAREVPERIRCPALLMLSGRDRIVDTAAVRDYFKRLGSARRQVREYPEACHTLEFEPDRDRIVDDLIGWLGSLGSATHRRRPAPAV